MATSEPNEAAPDLDDVHWREYPIGFAGELAQAVSRTLMPLLTGVGVTFALMLSVGLIAEEGLIDYSIAAPLDLLFRMSMGVVLGVAYLSWVLTSITLSLRHITASRAIDDAAAAGAPVTAVPHPSQVEQVIKDSPWMPLQVLAAIHIVAAVLGGITSLGFLGDSDGFGIMMLLGCIVVTVIMVMILSGISRRSHPAHRQRRERIARYWTTPYEKAAWQAARQQSTYTIGGKHFINQGGRLRLGGLLTSAGTVLSAIAVVILYAHIFISHPEAETFRYSYNVDAGPRAEYDSGFEAILASALWVTLALVVAALVAFLAGALIEARAHTAERAGLRNALQDSVAVRPPRDLLARYAERHPMRFAQVAAAIGGIGLVFGPATIVLGTVEMRDFAGGVEHFADLTGPAVIVTVVSAVLIVGAFAWNAIANVRGQELRNRLMGRWPTLPPQKPDSEGEVNPARTGPALTPQPERTQPTEPRG